MTSGPGESARPCSWCKKDYSTASEGEKMRHFFTCQPPPGWTPSAEDIEANADSFAESIVRGVENLELQGLSDKLTPRSDGAMGMSAYMRKFYAPAFERVYKKRREQGGPHEHEQG